MNAETLRRAAAAIRKDQDANETLGRIGVDEFRAWLHVADWLDLVVRTHEPDETGEDWWTNCPCEDARQALAVAKAYLGEAS